MLVVGGAHIDTKLIRDFEAWGITVVQGYGITECAPVISCNTDRYRKYASVGKVVTGCRVKLMDNEICVKGPIVMKGYYKNSEATAEVFEGEWFKTGDLGRLDKANFLYITGRKKNLIILPNGENVSPEELEQKILRIPYVKEVLVSEGTGQIQAEVFLDKEAEQDADLKIHEDITLLNRSLPNYKKIAKIVIREILAEYVEIPAEQITMETIFLQDLELSSLDVMDIVVTVEEKFAIEIPERRLSELVPVADVVKVLEEVKGK